MSDNILIRVRSYMGAGGQGAVVDLSGYYNKTEVDNKIQKQSEITNNKITKLEQDISNGVFVASSVYNAESGEIIVDYSMPIESIAYDDETGLATFVMQGINYENLSTILAERLEKSWVNQTIDDKLASLPATSIDNVEGLEPYLRKLDSGFVVKKDEIGYYIET